MNKLKKDTLYQVFDTVIKDHIRLQVKELAMEVWEENHTFMTSSALQKEKKTFYITKMKHGLENIIAKAPEYIGTQLQQQKICDEKMSDLINKDIRLFLHDLTIDIPVFVDDNPKTSHLKKLSIFLLATIGFALGTMLGNLFVLLGIGPLLAAFTASFGTVYMYFMVEKWQCKNNWIGNFIRSNLYSNEEIKTTDNSIEYWCEDLQKFVQDHAENICRSLINLYWLIGDLRIKIANNTSDDDLSVLRNLFHKCADALSEIYYCDQRRDESDERAIDACIKLIGDLEGMEIAAKFVESGSIYNKDFDTSFNKLGHVNEQDCVVTIYPAWMYKNEIMAKGKIKKQKRVSK